MADYKNPIKIKAAGRGVQWLADCKIPRPLKLAIAAGEEVEIEEDWISGMVPGSYEEISKAKPKRKPKKVQAKAEEVILEVDAGADGKFGTEDDVVSVVEESQKEKEAPAEPEAPAEEN